MELLEWDKRRKRIRAAFEMIVIALGLALIWLALSGCRSTLDVSGPYKGDTFLFNADKVIVDSKHDLSGFLVWEQINRTRLAANHLQTVTASADAIRMNAPMWFSNAVSARNLYSNSVASRLPPAMIASSSNALFGSVTALQTQTLVTRALTNAVNLK